MALIEQKRAKRFKLYKNGDTKYTGKDFVLNERRIRTFDSLLQTATTDLKFSEAIRSIRTPVGGTRIADLDHLEENQNYVAVGNGKFKKIGYLEIENNLSKLHSPRQTEQPVKPVEHNRKLQVSGRIRKIPTDVMTIFVYSNGNILEPLRRVTLTHKMRENWNTVLGEVTEKVHLPAGAARKLYTCDGIQITKGQELAGGERYVAVGAEVGGFKQLDYGNSRPAFNSSPKRDRRKLEPLYKSRNSRHSRASDQTGTTLDSSAASSGVASSQKSKSTSKSPARRKPPPYRPPQRPQKVAAKKKEEDDVFHAKPVKHRRSVESREPEVDYDKDEGGVFKAKGGNKETDDAEEVEESKDTKVELPIDQVEAEEVKDEDIESDEEKKAREVEKKNFKENPRRPKAKTPPPESSRKSSAKSDRKSPAKEKAPSRTPTPPQEKAPSRTSTPKGKSTPDVDDSKQQEAKEEQNAAVKIQANYRGYQARKDVKKKKEEKEKAQENDAAVKIQSNFRGYKTRKDLKNKDESTADDIKSPKPEEKEADENKPETDEKNKEEEEAEAEAAVKIQTGYKGYKARKDVKKMKEEKAEGDSLKTT